MFYQYELQKLPFLMNVFCVLFWRRGEQIFILWDKIERLRVKANVTVFETFTKHLIYFKVLYFRLCLFILNPILSSKITFKHAHTDAKLVARVKCQIIFVMP